MDEYQGPHSEAVNRRWSSKEEVEETDKETKGQEADTQTHRRTDAQTHRHTNLQTRRELYM